jgi:hypothetical protein
MNKREEMLNKVLAVAKRNGYEISDNFFTDVQASEWFNKTKWPDLYFSMLFSKTFAFHYWGDSEYMEMEDNSEQVSLENYDEPASFLLSGKKDNIALPSWQYHLIQMVLSDDPLVYAHKFAEERDINKPVS